MFDLRAGDANIAKHSAVQTGELMTLPRPLVPCGQQSMEPQHQAGQRPIEIQSERKIINPSGL
jgi:hypothetical protein